MGDNGDKIIRMDGDVDITFDVAVTAQNDKDFWLGFQAGQDAGQTADGCWLVADRVDGTTPWKVSCRNSTTLSSTNLTGSVIDANRHRFRIRRSGSTVYASIDGGTETTHTTNLPTTTAGGTPAVIFHNDVSGAAGTLYFFRFGMAY